MPELLLPSPDSSRSQFLKVTKVLGVPLNVYDGYFIDGDTEINVIIDTTDRPHVEDGELYSDPLHEVSVSETTIDGRERKIPSPDADQYPFTRRVEGDKLRLALIGRLSVTHPAMVSDTVSYKVRTGARTIPKNIGTFCGSDIFVLRPGVYSRLHRRFCFLVCDRLFRQERTKERAEEISSYRSNKS